MGKVIDDRICTDIKRKRKIVSYNEPFIISVFNDKTVEEGIVIKYQQVVEIVWSRLDANGELLEVTKPVRHVTDPEDAPISEDDADTLIASLWDSWYKEDYLLFTNVQL